MAHYEIIALGSPREGQLVELRARIAEMAAEFSLRVDQDVVVMESSALATRNRKAAAVALYFGGDPGIDVREVGELEADKVPVVPVVAEGVSVSSAVPEAIHHVNACFVARDDIRLEALTAVALEIVGLLHRQRRVFVSYRRSDSREAAVQLHDELSGRGFDVFLDTHDIRPGADFQETLWHRLVDCDVMIMLDTRDYFGSKWTKQELGRALALGVQILRLVWPDHEGSRHLSLSDTIMLTKSDLDPGGRLPSDRVTEVARRTEALRSRSIATRQLELAGKLRVEVERIGGRFEGIGAYRAMSLSLPNGKMVEAYPAVGVPTANLLNDIHAKAAKTNRYRFPCLVYDHVGIRPAWLDHLAWLDENISGVRTLRIFNAGWELAAWDS